MTKGGKKAVKWPGTKIIIKGGIRGIEINLVIFF